MSRTTGRTSRSTQSATVSTTACSSVLNMMGRFLPGDSLDGARSSDERSAAQRGDRVVGPAELAQDRIGVLAGRRDRSHYGLDSGKVNRWTQGGHLPAGHRDGAPAVAPVQHGMV